MLHQPRAAQSFDHGFYHPLDLTQRHAGMFLPKLAQSLVQQLAAEIVLMIGQAVMKEAGSGGGQMVEAGGFQTDDLAAVQKGSGHSFDRIGGHDPAHPRQVKRDLVERADPNAGRGWLDHAFEHFKSAGQFAAVAGLHLFRDFQGYRVFLRKADNSRSIMSVHSKFDNPQPVSAPKPPIVLRFQGLHPDSLGCFDMHDHRTGGDLSHVDLEVSELNEVLHCEPKWQETIKAEVAAAKTLFKI